MLHPSRRHPQAAKGVYSQKSWQAMQAGGAGGNGWGEQLEPMHASRLMHPPWLVPSRTAKYKLPPACLLLQVKIKARPHQLLAPSRSQRLPQQCPVCKGALAGCVCCCWPVP